MAQARKKRARTEPKKKTHTLGSRMRSWYPYCPEFLDNLLARDALSTTEPIPCLECHDVSKKGLYRCDDCHGDRMLCAECMVDLHQWQSFHNVKEWKNDHFQPVTLQELGLEIQLGHPDGTNCSASIPAHKDFLVFDTTGYHYVTLMYCNCKVPHVRTAREQLLDIGLYPASVRQPRTAFTFRLLDNFHQLTLQGKITLHDFLLATICSTDIAGLKDRVFRYHEATLATRQYFYLLRLKRAGRGHVPKGTTTIPLGGLAVLCPACPQPLWNLPPDWDQAPPEVKWIYTQFVALDACFKMKNKNRKIDDADIGSGEGYFVEEKAYQKHLQTYVEEPEQVDPCDSNFNAIKNINSTKSRTDVMAVSGAAAAKCSRHALMLPHGVADLQRGERYVTIDYVFWTTLQRMGAPLPVTVSYDIACQWKQNLWRRHAKLPASFASLGGIKLRFFIPSMHIRDHKALCRALYYFLLHRFVGLTHGETVEQEWAHIGGLATSTVEMGRSARRLTLDDHWNFWNFRKIVGFGDAFRKSFATTLEEGLKHHAVLEDFSQRFDVETIRGWELMIEQWESDPTKPNPYEEIEEAVNVNKLRQELAKEEEESIDMHKTALHEISPSAFVQQARKLKLVVDDTTSSTNEGEKATLQEKRATFRRRVFDFYEVQNVYMPGSIAIRSAKLSGDDGSDASKQAEDLPILLPSNLDEARREYGCLGGVTDTERRFADAMMRDGLINVRRFLRTLGMLRRKAKHTAGSQRDGTRSRTLIDVVSRRLKLAADSYRVAYKSLTKLDPAGTWCSRYKELRKEDLRGPSRDDTIPDEESERHRTPSWIWTLPSDDRSEDHTPNETTDKKGGELYLRGEWARQRARVHRHDEELILLQEEMRRVLVFLCNKSQWWEKQWLHRLNSEDQPLLASSRIARGLKAYGLQQARMYQDLAKSFAGRWIPLLKHYGISKDWIQEYEEIVPPEADKVFTKWLRERKSRQEKAAAKLAQKRAVNAESSDDDGDDELDEDELEQNDVVDGDLSISTS
ncbi:hypothetical protein PUNSTDRAFT_136333 [Punctularia strigosozonata HHB-11173 SS5]|uniref:uncharacterized protein n=1 Tax=Punctularia strigosozonata (strain HHB-11173) TaxID=741275 RepID=UPI0004417018|nr:uncharacterized protein PUNSTDRAFT_136333 [Punctularia strigosozonata HHB-11173 SS5]EIN06473.1 hypothetical protein PUNSTDRAFT_136333 [Punctularia strigosozonata HHB-11173 SS5]